MSDEASAVNAVWRGLLEDVEQWGTVLWVDGSRTFIHDRRSHRQVTFEFGPIEWYEFVFHPSPTLVITVGEPKPPRTNPYWALEHLEVVLGSQGSPVRIEGGRLVGGGRP